MSDTASSTDGDAIKQPQEAITTTSDRQHANHSPARSHSSTHSETGSIHQTNGFQQVPLEFENLGGSHNLQAAKEGGNSTLATAISAISSSNRDSVLSSVLHQLRKPSFETMYDLVEDDDYADDHIPEDRAATPVVKDQETKGEARTDSTNDIESDLHEAVDEGQVIEQHGQVKNTSPDSAQNVGGHSVAQDASMEVAPERNPAPRPLDTSAIKPGKHAPISIMIPSPAVRSTTFNYHERSSCTGTPTSVVPQTPISVHSSVDIASPRPDLQSLQGAYVGNIERLERSVEHLSENPDIDSEIQRMKREMKDRASSSGSVSAKKSTSVIGSPVSGPIVASPERYVAHSATTTSPRSALAMHSRSHSGSYSATSRLPDTLSEVPEPDENDQLLGRERPMVSDINDNASFTRSAMPPPMTPSPTLHPVLDVQVTTPSTVYAGSHANVAEDMGDLPNFEFSSYGYDNPQNTAYQPDLFMPTYPPQTQNELYIQRPSSAASGDTYQQAKIAFKDFDGVHIGLHPRPSASIRRFDMDGASLNEATANPDGSPMTTALGPDGQPKNIEGLVYYPAPVPRMLNMPKKLAKNKPDAQQQKRRTQLLVGTIAATSEHPDSSGPSGSGAERGKRKNPLAKLPPALRAAAFFDGPLPGTDDIVLAPQNGSAVQTMDAVLDAAVGAPVDATVDAGLGAATKPRNLQTPDLEDGRARRGLLRRDKGKQKAVTADANGSSDDERPRTGDRLMGFNRQSTYEADKAMLAPDEDEGPSDEDSEGQLDSDEDGFHGAPATLLAELELRKKAQKKRTQGKEIRSRARTGFGNMGSTLLEMDTVAQLQNEARRKKKHITLAWENPNAALADSSSSDDDDVPLAVLLKNKAAKEERTAEGLQRQIEEFKPAGLMAQLDQDENEPLAKRRARLRGEPQLNPWNRRGMAHPRAPSFMQDLEEESEEDEIEGETLAQRAIRLRREETETLAERIARLKREREGVDSDEGLSSDFAKDLLNLFDETKGNAGDADQASERGSQKTEENESKKRTSRYRTTKAESIDKRQSRIVPRPQPHMQTQSDYDLGAFEGQEGETLAQRKAQLLRETQTSPGADATNEVATGSAEKQDPMAPAKARASLADVLAAHPQHHSVSMLQMDRLPANANQNSRANPYMNAGRQVANAIGAPLYASDNNKPNTDRPGTLLGDWAKQRSTFDLNALNTAANNAARQPGGLQSADFENNYGAHNTQTFGAAPTMPSYQTPNLQQHQRMTIMNPHSGQYGVQGSRALTMTGAPSQYPLPHNDTRSMTFQGMPLYAHYHAEKQHTMAGVSSKPPNSSDNSQQPFRMSYLPGAHGQSQMVRMQPGAIAPVNPLLAQDGSVTAGYHSGFAQGYRAGVEQALRMTMMGTPRGTGEGEAVDQWRQNVAY